MTNEEFELLNRITIALEECNKKHDVMLELWKENVKLAQEHLERVKRLEDDSR